MSAAGAFAQTLAPDGPEGDLGPLADQLWSEAYRRGGRSAAAEQMLILARDSAADIHMREIAVDRLAQYEAVEAADAVKTIAESLSWADDHERELANRTTAAYHRLRYARETDRTARYALLVDTVRNAKGAAWLWAKSELIRNNHHEALPVIVERIRATWSGAAAESAIRLCRLQLEVVSSGAPLEAALEDVARGQSGVLQLLSADERESVQIWARGELQILRNSKAQPGTEIPEVVSASRPGRMQAGSGPELATDPVRPGCDAPAPGTERAQPPSPVADGARPGLIVRLAAGIAIMATGGAWLLIRRRRASRQTT